ncbi:MAG TPA: methyltransferase domain-containing protein, partial [Candidatus Angelobacter sp.]|nr:methyltransferase domain-containing protein [Candidatus Angelobacter sp.]
AQAPAIIPLNVWGAQTGAKADAQPTPRKTSKPYTGDLSIFEDKDRDGKLQVQRVMDILGVKEGAHVADIGAGSGWFTVRAAKRVGSTGIVYAVDINPESIVYIKRRIRRDAIGNVRAILSTEDDPGLSKNSVDSVLLLKTYHEVAHPVLLLENLRRSLRSGARVGIIDRNGQGDDHGVSRDVVIQEAAQAGYQLQEQYGFVKGDGQDYFLVFRSNSAPK